MTGAAQAAAAGQAGEASSPPGLSPGTRVRVRNAWPETAGPCHVRTPHYLRGRLGTVRRRLGAFPDPEQLAFARPAAVLPLYHVTFDRREIWPDARPGALLVEVFGSWLEPVEGAA